MKNVSLNVNGMMCQGCANRIKNALSTLQSVKKTEVFLDRKQVIVEADGTLNTTDLKEKIETLGFEVVD